MLLPWSSRVPNDFENLVNREREEAAGQGNGHPNGDINGRAGSHTGGHTGGHDGDIEAGTPARTNKTSVIEETESEQSSYTGTR